MAILRPAADDLVRVGGHAQAAGLTIRRERLDAFIAKVYAATEKYVSEHGISTPLAVVDAILDFPQITPALLNDIQLLEPFGEGNPTPTFLTRAVRALPGALRVVGKNHLSGELSRQGFVFRAIGFGLGHRIEEVQQEEDVDIFYTPQWHTWRNQTEIRLGLHDITSSKKTRVESST
jgi:single-stranded-DNA-specific exonuclease